MFIHGVVHGYIIKLISLHLGWVHCIPDASLNAACNFDEAFATTTAMCSKFTLM